MVPVQFGGHYQVGQLFHSRNRLRDMGWPEIEATVANSPSRTKSLNEIANYLNDTYKKTSHDMMKELFDGWPANELEEWTVDYNTEFMLKFDAIYEHATLETTLFIKVYGITNISWIEYAYTYDQAQTMLKLKSGL